MHKFIAISLTAFFTLATAAHAQDEIISDISDFILETVPDGLLKDLKTKSDFEAIIELGGISNDNLSVTEVDVTSGNSDLAAKGSVFLSYKQGLGENLKLGVSYKGSQTLYKEFTEFDFRSHLFTGKIDYNLNDWKLGILYRNVDSSLANEDFLAFNQISPYVARFIDTKTFLRAAYVFSDRQFESIEDRNATEHQARLDAYRFLDGTRQYLTASYALKLSNAEGDPFDYLSHKFKLGYVHKFPIANRKWKLSGSWSYEIRDYDNVTPSIGDIRDDNRHKGNVELEVPLNKSIYGRLEYQRQINSSNLPTADFDRNTVSVTMGARF